jgi:membrane-bound ClpP family serine protease
VNDPAQAQSSGWQRYLSQFHGAYLLWTLVAGAGLILLALDLWLEAWGWLLAAGFVVFLIGITGQIVTRVRRGRAAANDAAP